MRRYGTGGAYGQPGGCAMRLGVFRRRISAWVRRGRKRRAARKGKR